MTGGRDIKNTRQPLNTFFQQNVEPFQKSSIILSGGVDRPYYYSLGNQSTVPFVRLQGSGGTQKEFTWGETVEVLPGQNVQVESASYMAGDIQIQSGQDTQNKPGRISIPIQVDLPQEAPEYESQLQIRPIFPCDCRGAKRAYLGCHMIMASETGPTTTVTFYGINKQHSWSGKVPAAYTSVDPTGKKYLSRVELAYATSYGLIPMGFQAELAPSDCPMTLAD
jgi:hypothetical protein